MKKIAKFVVLALLGAVIAPFAGASFTDISLRRLPMSFFINFEEITHEDIMEGETEQVVTINRRVNKTYTNTTFTKSIHKIEDGIKKPVKKDVSLTVNLEKSANGVQSFLTTIEPLEKGTYCVGRHYLVLMAYSELTGDPIYRDFDTEDACFNVL